MAESTMTRRVQTVAVPPLHPVHTLMEEHRFILRSLRELKELLPRIREAADVRALDADREALRRVAHHLVDAENHHQREEDALFPRMRAHGLGHLVEPLLRDHTAFRERKRRLYQLAHLPEIAAPEGYKAEVLAAGEYIAANLEAHIGQEDDVVYQAALGALSEAEWERVRRECDAIGYCCFKPADHAPSAAAPNPAAPTVALDMREVPMLKRLDVILKAWKELPAGGEMRLVNDREPLPLRLMFRAREAGKHEWTYEKEGPTEWVAVIRRKA